MHHSFILGRSGGRGPKNWDSATVDEIGWLLYHSCALKSNNHDNALGSGPYKVVLFYMPDARTQNEVLAVCMVSKMTCDVILYGAGENQKDINLALEKAQKQYKKLLSRAFSSKAGSFTVSTQPSDVCDSAGPQVRPRTIASHLCVVFETSSQWRNEEEASPALIDLPFLSLYES
jgi:hypothetical protein